MSEPSRQLAEVELEPLATGGQRGWEADQAWKSFRGKVNRISIGLPRWELSGKPRRKNDRAGNATSATMTVDLTLLPDVGCRFMNAELAVRLEPAPGCDQAIVTRLAPTELAEHEVITHQVRGGVRASLGQVVETGVELSGTRREEVSRTLVRLAAFGSGTPEAGWRFILTHARDIPFNTTDLTTTIACPTAWRGTVWFSVVAQLQVRSPADRWLTAAFGLGDSARLKCFQPFPPVSGGGE